MKAGCQCLQASEFKKAFELLNRAFTCLKPTLILQNIKRQPILCDLIAQFSRPLLGIQPLLESSLPVYHGSRCCVGWANQFIWTECRFVCPVSKPFGRCFRNGTSMCI